MTGLAPVRQQVGGGSGAVNSRAGVSTPHHARVCRRILRLRPLTGKTGAPPGRRAEDPMKLSTKGRYAVTALADIALQNAAAADEARLISLSEIAERQDISLAYLEQLFSRLRRAGLVESVRGPGGGYLLAHTAAETRIADIIIAVDEPIKATRCTPGSPAGCTGNKSRCLPHDLWGELGNKIYLYLLIHNKVIFTQQFLSFYLCKR